MDKETIGQYVNLDQIECAEIALDESKNFGEIASRAVKALFMTQPEGRKNYSNYSGISPRIGTPYLFRGLFERSDNESDAVIKYNSSERQEIPLALIDVKKNLWHKIIPEWDEAPQVLQKDTREVLGWLGLKEKR